MEVEVEVQVRVHLDGFGEEEELLEHEGAVEVHGGRGVGGEGLPGGELGPFHHICTISLKAWEAHLHHFTRGCGSPSAPFHQP